MASSLPSRVLALAIERGSPGICSALVTASLHDCSGCERDFRPVCVGVSIKDDQSEGMS